MKYIALTFVAIWLSIFHVTAQLVSEIIEYHPAPGQLINTDMAGSFEAARSIVWSVDGLVSLGSFGGNVVYRFDQPVVNDPLNPYGVDFVVFGNPQPDWAEPGIVMVMKDMNKNGKADDIWYELAGSDYFFSTTNHKFSVTYFNPIQSAREDISWISNDSRTGYVFKNSFHKQNYYPSEDFFSWNVYDTVSFTGTLIDDEVDFSNPALIKSHQRKFGYADNIVRKNSNFNLPDNPYTVDIEGCGGDGMDIGWAVDGEGHYIDLDQIDFVKIYNGVLGNAGWMGEISTELCGIADVPANASVSGATKCIVISYLPEKIFSGSLYALEAKFFQNGRIEEGEEVLWNVDNHSIASISKEGLLLPSNDGTLKITASLADDPSIIASLTVDVITPSKIDIVIESGAIRIDEEKEIKATVRDDSQNVISGVEIDWCVQDNDVLLFIEKDGKYYIKGQREGVCLLEAHLKNKPELKSSVTVSVLSESTQKEVFVTVKDEHSTLVPRDKIVVKNFNLNPFVDHAQGNYDIQNVSGISVAHALAQVFVNSGWSDDFRFRDDEKGENRLYVWKVPKGDLSNVEYVYGYGGSTTSTAFSKSWIVLLNNDQIISGLDQQTLKNGDELIVYHVSNIMNEWKVSCFVANKNAVTVEDTLEVYSTELTCNRNQNGSIQIKSSSPLQNQMIWVDDQEVYFNGDRVATDEIGMAEMRFGQPGIKKISTGIDEMVVTVSQPTSSAQIKCNQEIKIWPQPATDLLNISVSDQRISSITIFDTFGRRLLNLQGMGTDRFSLNTGGIIPGIYFLQISTDQGIFNHKILLQ